MKTPLTRAKLVLVAAMSLVCLAAVGAMAGDDTPPASAGLVIRSSAPISAVNVATTMTQVDTPKLDGSWGVFVVNNSTNPICCALDSGATNATGSGRSCEIIGPNTGDSNTRLFMRWWQNLSLYCLVSSTGLAGDVRARQMK